MNAPILCIRPQPGASATQEAGAALGLEIAAIPLFAVRPVDWRAPDPAGFDAILAGSANAFRHGGTQLSGLTTLPVHAVGAATAAAARDAGFAVDSIGRGGLQNVVDALADKPLRLLRLSGADRVALQMPANLVLEEVVVYESAVIPLPGSAVIASQIVLLHSARAATHFASECRRLGVQRGGVRIAALGSRIAQAAGPGWAEVRTSSTPDDAAVLALAREMCHSSPLNAPPL